MYINHLRLQGISVLKLHLSYSLISEFPAYLCVGDIEYEVKEKTKSISQTHSE